MTKPPCKTPDGIDCPRRYIGCQSSCQEYHKWLMIHAEEKKLRRQNYRKQMDADTFQAQQGDRIHKLNRVRNAQEKARRR